MQHDVLLGRDSWMRFKDRSYRTLAPRPENNQVLGKLTLSLSGLHGATAFVPASSTHSKTCHLLNAGDVGITLSREHRLIQVDLVRRNGAPALAGCYLVDMLHAADTFSTEKTYRGKWTTNHPVSRRRGLGARCLARHLL